MGNSAATKDRRLIRALLAEARVRDDRLPRGVLAAAVTGIAVLVAATILGLNTEGTSARQLSIDIAVGVAACALVPLLMRRSALGAVALAVLAAVSPAATPAATVGTLQTARRRPFVVAGIVAAIGVLAHAVRWWWRPVEGLSLGWWLVLVVVAHAALLGWGAAGRARDQLICHLAERARTAEREQGRRVAQARAAERTAIASEMHDVLAHRLSLIATHAGAMEYRPDAPSERLAQAAGVVRAGVHEALEELRGVIALLHGDEHEIGDDDSPGGLQPPQPRLSDVPHLVHESREAGMDVDLDVRCDLQAQAPPALGRTAFRVIQESLTNARKHASGAPVRVRINGARGTQLSIEVASVLPSAQSAADPLPGAGRGLVGLHERVRLAGGVLDHGPVDGEFRVSARLPWPG